MVDLKKLIEAAPFPQDTKGELLAQVGSLNSDKKTELLEMCWALISKEYQNKLAYTLQYLTRDAALSHKKISEEDIQKVKDQLYREFSEKLGVENNPDLADHLKSTSGSI